MKIFLSGAMEGLEDKGSEWRREATIFLEPYGYQVVSPIAVPDKGGLYEPNEVVRRNAFVQKCCDLLLVEYSIPDRAYIGTDYEIVKAYDWGQPVIVWAHEMYSKRIYLRYLATAILPSLEEAMGYICGYYPPTLGE